MKRIVGIALLVLIFALFATSVAGAQYGYLMLGNGATSPSIAPAKEYGYITLYARDIYGTPINGATMGYWSDSEQRWSESRFENHSEIWIEMRDPRNVTKIRAYAPGYFVMEREIPIPSYQADRYDKYYLYLVPLGYVPPPPSPPGFPCWWLNNVND